MCFSIDYVIMDQETITKILFLISIDNHES